MNVRRETTDEMIQPIMGVDPHQQDSHLPASWVRLEWPHLAVVFIAIWSLYLVTAPRTVILEDDGLFILSSWFLGIEHPPGYPFYVLLAKLGTLWPFGSPAWRVHAVSALFGAAGCSMIYVVSRQLLLDRTASYFVALGLGVSKTYWSQSIIADVYSLHALIFFILLSSSLKTRNDPGLIARSPHHAYSSAFITGLALSNHWPLFLLSAPGIIILWIPAWRSLIRRLPGILLCFGMGLLPYAWMVWRSHTLPPISFQGPIDSWPEFIYFVLRRGYIGIDSSGSANAWDKLMYLVWLCKDMGMQFLLPGAALALLGFFAQWRRWSSLTAAALVLCFIGPSLVLVLLLNFDFDPLHREAFRVYPTAAWGIFALWIGLGIVAIRERLPAKVGRMTEIGVTAILVMAIAIVNASTNNRHGEWLARDFANAIISDLEPNSVLIITSDMHTPAVSYQHLLADMRPDIDLVNSAGLVLEPRPFDPYTTPVAAQPDIVRARMRDLGRPIYRTPEEAEGTGTVNWLTVETATDQGRQGRNLYRLGPAQRAFLSRLVEHGPFQDGWDELLRRYLLELFAAFLTNSQLAGQWPTDDAELNRLAHLALQTPEAGLMRAALLTNADYAGHAAEIEFLLRSFADQANSPWIDKRHLANFYNVIAKRAQLSGRTDQAREAIERSVMYWPGPENPAFGALQSITASPSGR